MQFSQSYIIIIVSCSSIGMLSSPKHCPTKIMIILQALFIPQASIICILSYCDLIWSSCCGIFADNFQSIYSLVISTLIIISNTVIVEILYFNPWYELTRLAFFRIFIRIWFIDMKIFLCVPFLHITHYKLEIFYTN